MCVRGCAGRRAHERAQASGRRRAGARAGRQVQACRRVRTYVCVPERTGVRMGVRVRMYARASVG